MTTMMLSRIGTPVPVKESAHENGILCQADLFMYKARECKSAPARAFETQPSASSSRCSSSSSSASSPEKKKTKNCKHKKFSVWPAKKFMFFFLCHAPEFTDWATSFSSTSRVKYLIVFFLEASFRSIGDVTFSSNPFSGFLIFLGMLVSCPQVAFLAFITLTFGIETSVVYLRVPLSEVRAGGVTFNNFLTGTVIGLLAQKDVLLAFPDIILICMGVGILTPIIWKGLDGLLPMPQLNATFHVMILLYMFSGMSARYKEQPRVSQINGINQFPVSIENSTMNSHTIANGRIDFMNIIENATSGLNFHEGATSPYSPNTRETPIIMNSPAAKSLSWDKVLSGIFLAPSQVYGTNSIPTSLLVYSAILVYSPIMLMQSVTGAAIGTIIGISLSSPDEYQLIYEGNWAYNPLLTTAALGGFFVVFNIHCWLLSLAGGIITTLLYSAMIKLHIPALGIPFMVTTWFLLPNPPNTSLETPSIPGPFLRLLSSQMTTPELHRAFLRPQQDSAADPTDKYKSELSNVNLQNPSNSVLPL